MLDLDACVLLARSPTQALTPSNQFVLFRSLTYAAPVGAVVMTVFKRSLVGGLSALESNPSQSCIRFKIQFHSKIVKTLWAPSAPDQRTDCLTCVFYPNYSFSNFWSPLWTTFSTCAPFFNLWINPRKALLTTPMSNCFERWQTVLC